MGEQRELTSLALSPCLYCMISLFLVHHAWRRHWGQRLSLMLHHCCEDQSLIEQLLDRLTLLSTLQDEEISLED